MGFLAFTAALLNFDHSDHLWHIHTPQATKECADHGTIMHVRPEDGIRLIEVPFSRAAQPIFSRLLASETTTSATSIIDSAQEQSRRIEEQRCQNLISRLTSTQRRVLQTFAQGLTPQQVADKLCISMSTVSTHQRTTTRVSHRMGNS